MLVVECAQFFPNRPDYEELPLPVVRKVGMWFVRGPPFNLQGRELEFLSRTNYLFQPTRRRAENF